MLTIEEIRAKYDNGDYTYRVSIPAKVSPTHVFDENLTIKRNAEMIKEHNAEVDRLTREARQKQNELYAQMKADVIAYLTDTWGFTQKQAEEVESFTYTEKHAFMCDYFSFIDTFAEFASSILEA